MVSIPVTICTLDGERHLRQVTPQTELASLKNEFSSGSLDFYKTKLLLGTSELCGPLCRELCSSPDAEVTLITCASPALAVQAVLDYYQSIEQPKLMSLRESRECRQSDRNDRMRQLCSKALAFLCEIGELPDEDGYILSDWLSLRGHYAELAAMQPALAKTIGRCCSKELVVAQLEYAHQSSCEYQLLGVTIALGEVMNRDATALQREPIVALLISMADQINLWKNGLPRDWNVHPRPDYVPPPIEMRLPALMVTCRLASEFADADLLQRIQEGVESLRTRDDDFGVAAYEAVTDQFAGSGAAADRFLDPKPETPRGSQDQDGTSEFAEARPTTVEQLEGHISDEAETEPGLNEALEESGLEAWRQEQGHLHEALLRSKADDLSVKAKQASISAEICLVLLLFSRCPKRLFEVLLASPLASRLMQAGVELQPSWAAGRLILATGVTPHTVSEARDSWNLVVGSDDEQEVMDLLRGIEHDERPRLKLDGRFPIPGDLSVFNDASSTSDSTVLGEDWTHVPVFRTFLHVPIPSMAYLSPRTSVSAPAAL